MYYQSGLTSKVKSNGSHRFYVWSDESEPSKLVIFVSEAQATSLIGELDRWCRTGRIIVPDSTLHPGFICTFPDHPYLRPHWLGRSSSRSQFNDLEAQAPLFSMPADQPLPDRSLQAFRQSMDEAMEVSKNRKRVANAAKKQERMLKQQDMNRQVKRAQRYLGLRPRNDANGKWWVVFHLSEWSLIVYTDDLMPGLVGSPEPITPQPFHVDSPAPYTNDMDVIFISVDIEAYERNHHIITEIGLATLDLSLIHI